MTTATFSSFVSRNLVYFAIAGFVIPENHFSAESCPSSGTKLRLRSEVIDRRTMISRE